MSQKWLNGFAYALVVGSLMYAQVFTMPYIGFIVGMLGMYQINPGLEYWKAAKMVMRYLQGTKNYRHIYKRIDHLEVVGYPNSNYAGCVHLKKATSEYIFLLFGEAMSWRNVKQSVIAVYYEGRLHCMLWRYFTGIVVTQLSNVLKLSILSYALW